MIPIPRQLFVLESTLGFRKLVLAAVPDHLNVVEAFDAASLLDLLRHAAPLPLVLVDSSSLVRGGQAVRELRGLMEQAFYTGLVAVVDRMRGCGVK
jgi:hypothetical protein